MCCCCLLLTAEVNPNTVNLSTVSGVAALRAWRMSRENAHWGKQHGFQPRLAPGLDSLWDIWGDPPSLGLSPLLMNKEGLDSMIVKRFSNSASFNPGHFGGLEMLS